MIRRPRKAGAASLFARSGLQSETPAAYVYSTGEVAKVPPLEPLDMVLVADMAAGKVDALRALSQRYSRALLAVAGRILRDAADAEEVATDVLWQAWRQASAFDAARGSVSGWLMALTRSRAIDRLRARKSRRPAPNDGVSAELAPDPVFEVCDAERRRLVKGAVAALQENQRILLELAYFSDLPQSEIAARLGLPLGTVKTRTRSALIKLREALARIK